MGECILSERRMIGLPSGTGDSDTNSWAAGMEGSEVADPHLLFCWGGRKVSGMLTWRTLSYSEVKQCTFNGFLFYFMVILMYNYTSIKVTFICGACRSAGFAELLRITKMAESIMNREPKWYNVLCIVVVIYFKVVIILGSQLNFICSNPNSFGSKYKYKLKMSK